MARVVSGGQITVKAGIAAVTGGIGMGISAASNVEGAKDTLRDKTAAQVIAEVRATLASLGVPEETANRLVENRHYTPSFLLLMSRALARLHAQNTAAYVERAADANSYGVAYFHTRRADLISARSAELGGIVAFVPVAGHVVNVTRDGTAVAIFPLDDLAWTDIPQRTFRAATAELRRAKSGRRRGIRHHRPRDSTGRGRDQKIGLEDRSAQIAFRGVQPLLNGNLARRPAPGDGLGRLGRLLRGLCRRRWFRPALHRAQPAIDEIIDAGTLAPAIGQRRGAFL